MYNTDTELLFPPRLIPVLGGLRGELWRDLVDDISERIQTDVDRVAFVLFMVRLSGCLSCHADSYRALRGCTLCASHTIRRFRGSDQELIHMFKDARQEVQQYYGGL
jgi:hypothetical protein